MVLSGGTTLYKLLALGWASVRAVGAFRVASLPAAMNA